MDWPRAYILRVVSTKANANAAAFRSAVEAAVSPHADLVTFLDALDHRRNGAVYTRLVFEVRVPGKQQYDRLRTRVEDDREIDTARLKRVALG